MKRRLRMRLRLRRLRRGRSAARTAPRKLGRRKRVGIGIGTASLALAALAAAYWVAHGAGSASGSVATLSAPSISSATPGAGTVELAWSTLHAPAGGEVRYYVRRDGGAPGGGCPSSTAPTSATSCTDAGLAAGTHEYTVTAIWRSWTARSVGTSVVLASGKATQLVLAAASTTPTAGQAVNVTATVKDAEGNTVTAYTGTKSLTFGGAGTIGENKPTVTNSSGVAVNFGSPTSINFTSGVASVTGQSNGVMRLYKAESAQITVSDGTLSNGVGLGVAVSPAGAASFTLPTPATQTAGTGFEESIKAKDEFGNPATGYSGSKTLGFSGPSSSPGGKAPSYPATVTFTEGAGTASVTLYDAQSATLTAKDGPISGSTSSFAIASAAAASFTLAGPGAQTAGKAFEEIITAKDEYANIASGYSGAKAIAFSGPSSSPNGKAPSYPASVTFTEGAGAASIVLYDAQSATLTAKEGTLSGTSASFTVGAAAAASFALPTPVAQTAGKTFEEAITAKDEFANTATAYTGARTIAFSGPSSSPNGKAPSYPASVTFTEGAGAASITLYDAQSTPLTAKEGGLTGSSAGFTVAPAAAASFTIANPGSQTAGVAFELALTAKDEFANTASGYSGEHTLTFSGPSSSPGGEAPKYPGSVAFGEGSGKATVTLYNAASTAITAKDGAIAGSSTSFSVNPAAIGSIAVTNPGGQTAGKAFELSVTAKDKYGNGVSGAQTLAFSGPSSSPNGKAPSYPEAVTLSAGAGKAPITLYDAQKAAITVKQGSVSGASGEFTVGPAPASSLTVPAPEATLAGKAFEDTITAKDEYGNVATGYTGAHTLVFSGPASSPSGEAPKYPSGASTFSEGAAKVSITLTDAQATTLGVKEGTLSGTSPSFTVKAGTASKLSWNSSSSSSTKGKLTGPCLFTCVYKELEGEGTTFKAKVAVTDSLGNVVSAIGTSVTVTLSKSTPSKGGSAGTFTGSEKVTIPASGEAISNSGGDGSVAGEITYATEKGGWEEDKLSMTNSGTYTNASASFSKK